MITTEPTTELEKLKQELDTAWYKFKEASDISTKLGSRWVELNNKYKAALLDAAAFKHDPKAAAELKLMGGI